MPKKTTTPPAATETAQRKPNKYLVTAAGGGQPTAVFYDTTEAGARKRWAKRFGRKPNEAEAKNVSPHDADQ